jgi:xanthine dehydrogenase accessory factor
MNQEVFAALAAALRAGENVALVTIVAARGSTPQRVGAKMLVYGDGRTVGTIGGGCYEHDAFWKAREALGSGRARTVKYELSDDFAEESGLICGGQMEVFIEPVEPAPEVYVFGAGHVGAHLTRMAHDTGFRVHLVDDREKFADPSMFPEGVTVEAADIPEWLATHPLPPSAYAVIVTRGHRHDLDALRTLAGQRLRYLGLIGSRAKVRRVFDALVAEGAATDALAAVHAPIGLDIGAVTPQEIAVAILAELIAVRRGRTSDAGTVGASLRWAGALTDG